MMATKVGELPEPLVGDGRTSLDTFTAALESFVWLAAFPHMECAGYYEDMSDNLLDNLDVFYGELTPARATVYARLEGLETSARLSLSGFVRGPRCFYSKTLPATFRLQDAGPGPSLLAKSLVPDPCFWSPETPHIYDVTVELRKGTDLIASEVRQIGFKPLGISGRFFTWEGKPWVLRGVMMQADNASEISQWRDAATVLVAANLRDNQLLKASQCGVLCYLTGDGTVLSDKDAVIQARRWAKFPSVVMLKLEPNTGFDIDFHQVIPNIIICQRDSTGEPILFHSCMQVIDTLSTPIENAVEVAEMTQIPTLVRRPLYQPVEHAIARLACDKLQADLAPYGQFAGYIV